MASGIPQKDIAASLHHTRTATTDRYVKGHIQSKARAVAALPDVSPEFEGDEGPQALPLAATEGGSAEPAERLSDGAEPHGIWWNAKPRFRG
jgi:hypothetical protein